MLPAGTCRIGSYMSHGSEVDLATLHDHLFISMNHCFVPRILTKTSMEFAYLQSNADIINARYGIRTSNQQLTADIDTLDWLIMPCVAIRSPRISVGYGRRLLRPCIGKVCPMAPIRIGVAFNMQESKFEPDQWDQTFDWIVTENGVIRQ